MKTRYASLAALWMASASAVALAQDLPPSFDKAMEAAPPAAPEVAPEAAATIPAVSVTPPSLVAPPEEAPAGEASENPASSAPHAAGKEEDSSLRMAAGNPKAPIATPAPQPVALSLGNFPVSLMFNSEDINNLRQVLTIYENQSKTQTVAQGTQKPQDADLLAELLEAAQKGGKTGEGAAQEGPLPTFYLNTVLYENAKQWSLWINKQRISADAPENPALGLRVENVSQAQVDFIWKPAGVGTAAQRWKELQENPDSSKLHSHRAARNAPVSFDEQAGEFHIRMKPNQTFLGENMQVMEGRTGFSIVPDVAQTSPVSVTETDSAPQTRNPRLGKPGAAEPVAQAAKAPASPERDAADRLIRNTKRAGQLLGIQEADGIHTPGSAEDRLAP